MADIPRSIRLMEENNMAVRVIAETSGAFRAYHFEGDAFMREVASVPGGYTIRDGVYYECLTVFEATLPA